jgi:hypothetical protein
MRTVTGTIEIRMLAFRHAILALDLLLAPAVVHAQGLSVQAPKASGPNAAGSGASGPRTGAPIAPAPGVPDIVLQDDATPSSVRIFTPPPMRWDHAMGSGAPALHQGRSDLIVLTAGVSFGMQPEDVNALLPTPYQSMSWGSMPQATEFPGDVRYFWVGLEDAGPLRMGSKGCTGAGSYVVFLFTNNGLFRLSYRLVPDKTCPSVNETARDIFGRYVTVGSQVALSVRYHTGSAEVVDVTDPGGSFLIPVRWYQVGR